MKKKKILAISLIILTNTIATNSLIGSKMKHNKKVVSPVNLNPLIQMHAYQLYNRGVQLYKHSGVKNNFYIEALEQKLGVRKGFISSHLKDYINRGHASVKLK